MVAYIVPKEIVDRGDVAVADSKDKKVRRSGGINRSDEYVLEGFSYCDPVTSSLVAA